MFVPTMKILYGPPGTGKTWRAAREAVATVNRRAHQDWLDKKLSDEELIALHHRYVLQGRIKWVTFHPSYSYEDFVEGFRPTLVSKDGSDGEAAANQEGAGKGASTSNLAFRVHRGPFRQICDFAAGHPEGFGPPMGSEIEAIGGGKKYEVIAASDQGWLLRVRPNRTDQVGEVQEKFVHRRVIEKAEELNLSPKIFSIPGKGAVKPSDYGLPGEQIITGSELRRVVAEKLGVSSSDLANSAHFGAVAAYIRDRNATPSKPVRSCLVIDEINRADLSRVFGELITLLEPDKRVGAKEERRVHLPYSGEPRFGVPATLSIIGTLNTADRSITSMDFAMRRRFVFEEVSPAPALCPTNYGGVDVSALLAGLNRRIAILRSRDYEIGHAILMSSALEDIRERFKWADDDTGRLKALAYVIRKRVFPLLLEYFHEDLRKVEAALGVRGKKYGTNQRTFFDKTLATQTDLEQLDEILDASEGAFGDPASWWDPAGEFDAGGFAAAAASMK